MFNIFIIINIIGNML